MAKTTSFNWSRVLIDICTQCDFLEPGAILQVANLSPLVENLKRIFCWVHGARLGIVSCLESHRPTEMLAGFPLHCIDNTPGQAKCAFTLLKPWTLVEADNYLCLPPDLCTHYRQVIFRKRSRDILANPKTDRFLTHLRTDEVILCGVGMERAIKLLALGLLARHHRVTVVSDACGYWSRADADLAIRQLAAKGIRMVSTEELVTEPLPTRRPRSRLRASRNRHRPVHAGYMRRSTSGVVPS
ncbi:MAG TPA: cysteine hydrolase family protein [Phycisphaerae bacterium]|jgi:nicotinamidase-related amidase|nr:cysteine hydrolase family protein [Phycisphaerae bacterium]HOB75790.1 cysteine hydrolase family protein [Phycisphaerae bacterium]HOJ55578.1 cysteine hydrolase family protein [Phycisphaerae bacterium]HOL27726.1 cysteine hydrolase family protein [Phycisphaerae bacterium]HPP21892.1 cysteine hydrolase family protein [Phycisphaerae bacterium]